MKTRRGEVTPHPHSPLHKDLPLPEDLFSQQAGISVGARQPKHPRTGASSGPLPQSDLRLVSFDLQGMSVSLAVIGIAHLLRVL
jgi:hypothetical protein